MKKIDQQKIEAKVRALEFEPLLDDTVRMDEIKKRAYEEYMRRQLAAKEKPKSYNRLRRRVMVAVAAAVGIMVISFVYSAIAPVPVSSANNFVRRAAIWINNTLQMGIEFSVPVNDGAQIEQPAIEETVVYSSIQEAVKALGEPLVGFVPSADTDIQLERIEAVTTSPQIRTVQTDYEVSTYSMMIKQTTLGDENDIAPLMPDVALIDSSIGQISIWETDTTMRAMTVCNGNLIQIRSDMPYDEFVTRVGSLQLLN